MKSLPSSSDGGYRGILDLLVGGDSFAPGSSEDSIGFQEAEGIEVWENKATGRYSTKRHDLNETDSAAKWIANPISKSPHSSEDLCTKILMGDQVLANDHLHPPEDAGAALFSRHMLQKNFRLPAKALTKVANNSKWHMNFSQHANGPSRFCEGLGTSTHSFVMSRESKTSCLFIFLVWHRSGQRESRQTMTEYLERLSGRTLDAALFVLMASSIVFARDTTIVNHIAAEIGKTDLDLRRFATQKEADSLFGSAHASANSLDSIEQDLRSTLRLVGRHSRALKTKPSKDPSTGVSAVVVQKAELKDAFAHRIQELQTLLQRVAYDRNETARQLTTALNMMMYAQQQLTRQDQKISIEIAEASKTIAEETKKDGSSMKTLAIVTMCFLPATTVSSVLSMSFFNWGAESGHIISERLWVYFVLAIPLTLATLGIWWMWQRQLFRPSRSFVDAKT